MSGQSYTDVRDFMPYAVASVKSFIASGDIDGLQAFVNDLNTLSENIDSFITEIPGYLERYQQIMEQKRTLEEEDARRRAQQAEIDKRLREEFGIGADTGTPVDSGTGGAPQQVTASAPLNVTADDLIGDLGFDFTTPDDGSDDAGYDMGQDAPDGDAQVADAAYPQDGGDYGTAPRQDATGYADPYDQQDDQPYDLQQMPDDGQGYQAPYGADDFMGGYGSGEVQDGQYMSQIPDASFGQNPAIPPDYADLSAAPMAPSSMSQAPDMYAEDDGQVPTGGGQQRGYGDAVYPQDGGYGDSAYQDDQDGFDPFSQPEDGDQPQYHDYGQQDAYAAQQGYDQGTGYQDMGQGYGQDATGYPDQGYGQQGYDDYQMPQGYADEPSTGMSMDDLMAEADQNQPPKKRGRRKRGKGSGLKVTPRQQEQSSQQSYGDDAARMDALLDDDFDM